MNNPWLKYGWLNEEDEEDIENIQNADTLRQEDLQKILEEYNSKDPKEDGINCKLCKDWFYMAAPNEADGYFICRDCKTRPWRNSPINSD